MKLRLYLVLLMAMTLMLSACKDDEDVVNPPTGDTGNYFPDNNGAYYRFNFEYMDSTGAVTTTGSRVTRYTGTSTIGGTTYKQQTDSVFSGSTSASSVSYFRKTDTGVFYFLDTTGLSNTVPDSILQYITIDGEMRLLALPLQETSQWPVFKMTLNYIITLNVIEVSASVTGKENITLNLVTGNESKEAMKVRYSLTVRMPDPENPLQVITETVEAYSWVVSGIGIVRWQGSAAVVAAFTGGGIDIDESSSTYTQNLVEYRLN